MNRKLLATAVAGAIAPMAAQALDVSVSGHVNRAIRFADNGVDSDVQHIDGSASKSRFRFTAEGEPMPGITAGAHIEYGSSNNAGRQGSTSSRDDKGASFDARHSLLYFSGDFGKVTLGNAPSAGNGVMWTQPQRRVDGHRVLAGHQQWSGSDAMTNGRSVGAFRVLVLPERQHAPHEHAALRHAVHRAQSASRPVSRRTVRTSHDWHFGASLGHDVGAANVIAGIVYEEDKSSASRAALAFANGTSVNAAWGSDDDDGRGLRGHVHQRCPTPGAT